MLKKEPVPYKRLDSLDALRGFSMFWITGGAALVVALNEFIGDNRLEGLVEQMRHAPWEGFRFFDLIFPLFMFITGVTIPITVKLKLAKGEDKWPLFLKSFKRMLILIILGLFYNGVFRDGFTNTRYASVLGQIGIACFLSSLVVIYSRSFKTIIIWTIIILTGVATLQLFIRLPGVGAGVLTPEGCINGFIDRLFLPGKLAYGIEGKRVTHGGIFDALGWLCIISATGITLMGAIAGYILLSKNMAGYRQTRILVATGILLITFALLFSPYYPVIKKCWTSTYNLLAGGICFLLLAMSYLIIDIWHFRKWCLYFRVIGLNSIFAYLFVRIIPVNKVTGYFFGWVAKLSGSIDQLVISVGYILVVWSLLIFLYKKRIFIKV